MNISNKEYSALPLKIIITGAQCSGKYELAKQLQAYNTKEFKLGRLFSDRPENEQLNIQNSNIIDYLSTEDIKLSFENDALLFLSNFHNIYYEGITRIDFDKNNIFILSPEQMINIPSSIFLQYRILIIWLDGKKSNRKMRFIKENRNYDFLNQEDFDNDDIPTMVEYLRDKEYLYFLDEIPERIVPIIYLLWKEPQWINNFINAYNG